MLYVILGICSWCVSQYGGSSCVCASLNTFWRIVNRAHFMLLEISSLLAIITTNLKSGLLVLQGKPLHSEPGGFRNNWNFLFIDTSTVSTRRG